MSDEEVRAALRRLERMGVRLMRRPPDALLERLAQESTAGMRMRNELATDFVAWMLREGVPIQCGRARPTPATYFVRRQTTRLYACTLQLNHDCDHERRTERRVMTWPRDLRDFDVNLRLSTADLRSITEALK